MSDALEENRMLRWMIRHPIWATRILARSVIGRSRVRSGEPTSPVTNSLTETISFIERSVAECQVVNAIQHHIERELLQAPYLASEPYLRLRLRSAGQWLTRMNGGGARQAGNLKEGTRADILLLIHRSGVMQLTIALKLPDDITVDQYRDMSFGSSEFVSASRVSEPILRAAYGKRVERHLEGEWEAEQEEGVRWRMAQHESPATVSDLSFLYQEAIARTIKSEPVGDWFCYPAAFIEKVGCCGSEESFKDAHDQELKNAIARSVDVSTVRAGAMPGMIPEDCSLIKSTSLYCNMSSSLEVRWPGSRDGEFAQHLQRLVILESALLQYWQIRLLDRRVGVADGSVRQVREIRREAIFGLREYRNSSISFGTAMDLVERLLGEWRVDRLYGYVLESIDQLQQLVVAAESKRSARRANVLAGIALIVAIFLGLPAIDETLEIAKSVKVDGFLGITLKPFRVLASRGEKGTWIGYLIFLVVVFLSFLALTLKPGWPHARSRRREPGISWPLGTVRIERRDNTHDG
ncbi:hypothetical protein [Streptomyces sp. NPDC059479]|uniref:hypothetical protein n=1 Tax=Streptomyces sp. NPDC059479 TaxID=3346848 RepID=UPI003674116F